MARCLLILLFINLSAHSLKADKLPVNTSIYPSELEHILAASGLEMNGRASIITPDNTPHSLGVGIDPLPLRNSRQTSDNTNDNPLDIVDNMGDLFNDFTDEEATNIDKARATLLAVREAAAWVQKLDGSTLIDLPVGIRQDFGSTHIEIMVSAIRIYPTHAALEVFVHVDRPDWPLPLIFYSPDIRFTKNGGLSGLSSVGLMGNMAIPVEENKSMLVLKRAIYNPDKQEFEGGTYLSFDCDGFANMGLAGALHFSKEWLLRVLPDGKIDTTNRVVGEFDIEVEDNINDIIVDISLGDFIVPQCERVAWSVSKAVFDFSETEKRFDFPVVNDSYDPTISGDGFLATTEEWKGVYIAEFGIRWLDEITDKTKTSIPGITLYDLVIDHNGFSGFVEVTGLLPIEEGDIDGWDISVDRLGVMVIQNQPQSFEFQGMILVPLLKKDEDNNDNPADDIDKFYYDAYFNWNIRNYELGVALAEDKVFDMKIFKGQATIYQNTEVFFSYSETEGFGLETIIHGDFEIKNIPLAGKTLNLPKIAFNGIHLASSKKYIRNIGTWGLPTDIGAKFMGFGFNVDVLQIAGSDENAEFRVAASFEFAAGDGVFVSAKGAFRLKGKVEMEGAEQKQRYNYKSLQVDMIEVEAALVAIYFKGSIIFFREDSIWGTGFQGKLEIYVTGMNKEGDDNGEPGMGIGTMALFGTAKDSNNESYRYFMMDMMARLGPGITIPSTGMKLMGLGGGVYYRMNQLSVSQNIQDVAFDPGDPKSQPDAYTAYMLSLIGKSLSGTEYVPSRDVLFGVNATVVIALEEEETFNANITFTIQVGSNFGIDFIRMKGTANFMSPVSWTAPSCSGVSAALEMTFVFNSSTGLKPGFHANAHVFVNITKANHKILFGNASGVPQPYKDAMLLVCEESEIKYAGGMVLELTKDDWFINLGIPDKEGRISATAKLGTLTAGLDQYLDIGTNIPPFPPLPANVANLVQFGNINEAARSTGKGFAFGASFYVSLIDINYTIFKASIGLTAGFDLMMKQYETTICKNGIPLGENSFYSNGQAYVYAEAVVRGFGFEILDMGLAAAIQFSGPNPFFGKGAISGYYKVGPFGCYSGNCYFAFEFGEECNPGEGLDLAYKLIADVKPVENAENVPVNEVMFAAFNYPLGKDYIEYDNEGNELTYQLQLKTYELRDQNGNKVLGELVDQEYLMTFEPTDFLKSNEDYTLTVHVEFRELSNGALIESEERIIAFSTGETLFYIPESNVEYAYPGNGQFNYYEDAPTVDPIIKLNKSQVDLFNDPEYGTYIRLTSNYPTYLANISMYYAVADNAIGYSLPDDLINGQAYKVEVIRVPIEFLPDTLFKKVVTVPMIAGEKHDQAPTYNHFPGGDGLPEKEEYMTVLYTKHFRKSLHDDPIEKYNEFIESEMVGTSIILHSLDEPFGVEEVYGLYSDKSAFSAEGLLDETTWYTKYDQYETANGVINPYKDHSGRTDYNIAIQDKLSEDRVLQFGTGRPDNALFLKQSNTYDYLVSMDNMDLINIENQQGKMPYNSNAYLKYDISNVTWGDISYFMNETLQDLHLSYLISYQAQNQMNYYYPNCSSVEQCCQDDPEFKDWIKDQYETKLNASNHIFKGSYFINDTPEACMKLVPITINDKNNFFLTHSLNENKLTETDYPIKLFYKNPYSPIRLETDVFTITRIEPSNNEGEQQIFIDGN